LSQATRYTQQQILHRALAIDVTTVNQL